MTNAQEIAAYRMASYDTPEAAAASLTAELQNLSDYGDPFRRRETLAAALRLIETQKEATK